MLRRTPLARGKGFSRPRYAAPQRAPLKPATRRATYAGETTGPVAKDKPVRSETYRRLVAGLPCIRCLVQGYTQACHGDAGKGMGLKTDDRTCWPGCGPHPGTDGNLVPGCHEYVSREMGREERREFEIDAGRRTRRLIKGLGLWPESLAEWPGDEA